MISLPAIWLFPISTAVLALIFGRCGDGPDAVLILTGLLWAATVVGVLAAVAHSM